LGKGIHLNSLHPLRAPSFGLTKIRRGLSGFSLKKKGRGACKWGQKQGRGTEKRGGDATAVASTKSIPFRQMGEGKQPKKVKKTNCRRKTECGLHLTTDEGIHGLIYAAYSK